MSEDRNFEPPAGYVLSRHRGPFSSHNGPYFHRTQDARFWHAIRIGQNHCNSGNRLHGGMVATFADGLLATAVRRVSGVTGLTISLTCNYLGAGKIGDLLEGTADQIGQDGNIAYAEAEGRIGEDIVFTASGIFRLADR